jgi:hypothetical protein
LAKEIEIKFQSGEGPVRAQAAPEEGLPGKWTRHVFQGILYLYKSRGYRFVCETLKKTGALFLKKWYI